MKAMFEKLSRGEPRLHLAVGRAYWSLDQRGEVGPHVFVIDGENCRSVKSLMGEFAKSLGFPSYFGHNWDALDDCLEDIESEPDSNVVVAICNADSVLGIGHRIVTLLEVLDRAAQFWERENPDHYLKFVFLVDSGKEAELEDAMKMCQRPKTCGPQGLVSVRYQRVDIH